MPCITPLDFLFEGRKKLIVAEIGIQECNSTRYILKNFDIKRYYAIDPFENYEGFYNKFYDGNNGDLYYLEAIKKLKKFKNITLIREYSHNAVKFVKDGELDICWIDGNHDYDYVKQDIEVWFPKVKIGGYICGDDIFLLGVEKAVDEFFDKDNFDIFKGKRSWFIKKWEEICW